MSNIKTVASSKRELEQLLDRRSKIQQDELDPLDAEIQKCKDWIKINCQHLEEDLLIKENVSIDFTEYVISCEACGKRSWAGKQSTHESGLTFSQLMRLPTPTQSKVKG